MSLRDDILAANTNAPERDAIVLRAVQDGNVPSWVKSGWTSITLVDAKGNRLELFVMRDALAIGASIYCPVSIRTAQAIADELGALIVTPKIADAIFNDSRCQRVPFQGIPATHPNFDTYMQTSEAMLEHSDAVNKRVDISATLVMGHSKTLAIGRALSGVGIYGGYGGAVHGWAIQGYPSKHSTSEHWIDYSDQLNLVSLDAVYNGSKCRLDVDIFERSDRVSLVDYGGVPFSPRWPTSSAFGPGAPPTSGGSGGGAPTVVPGGRKLLPRSNVGGGANIGEALFVSLGIPLLSGLAWYSRHHG